MLQIIEPDPPRADADSRELLREMIVETIRSFEGARELLARVDEASPEYESPAYDAWQGLQRDAKNLIDGHEAALVYLLQRNFDDLAPEGTELPTGEFEPFGVVSDGIAYIVRHDPGNMAPKIITRCRLDLVVALD